MSPKLRLLTRAIGSLAAEPWAGAMVVSAGTLAVWGLWLLLPGNTFTCASTYDLMELVAPEEAWGTLALFVGLFQALGVLSAEASLLRRAAFVALLLYIAMAATTFAANPHSPAGGVYLVQAFSNGWAYIKLGSAARAARFPHG